MKKFVSILMSILLVVSMVIFNAVTVFAETAEEEHTYYAVGSAPLFNPEWTPNAEAYKMTKISDTEYFVSIPVTEDLWGETIAYKVVQDGTWDVSYNENGQAVGEDSNSYIGMVKNTFAVDIIFNTETKCASYAILVIPIGEPDPIDPTEELPTEESTEPTEEITEGVATEPTEEAPTDEATAPTEEATTPTEEGPTDVATAPTDEEATKDDIKNETTAPTTTTDATKATSTATTKSINTLSTAMGKVATGNTATVALIIGVLMLAGAGIVATRKKISK